MKRLLLASTILFAAACTTPAETAQAPTAPQVAAAPAASAAPAAAPAPAAPAAQPASAVPAAPPAPTEPTSRTDFAKVENWLCRPGLANNPCEVNIDATIIKADGSTTLEKFKSDPNAPIDCFYIYPTVSLDPFTYSDLVPGPEEFNVVKAQLNRFGSKCRIYAPMYRQFSLGALRARMSGGASGAGVPSRGNALDGTADVDDAWDYYLKNDNKGRGVVIIGHSQGSGQITRLIASKIDGKPDQAKLVSAIIMGSAVQVPKGKDVGGTFKSIPVCKSAHPTGCVLSFSTYRDTVPPSATAGFGINRGENEAVCTNPAALAGGKATNPKAYWGTFGREDGREFVKGKKITTPFVMTPGLITTECVSKGNHHYLEVHLNADPSDPRTDDPLTDVMAQGKPDPSWGLHLNDANVGMGDLVDIVGKQGAAWKKKHP
ncbi:MAG TPA: DUF3089 domain-containing protein [Hyphomonadaceae bacterium]|nr:DUF3089 domain-containing protein [Hyphomonadaceae bacterium]